MLFSFLDEIIKHLSSECFANLDLNYSLLEVGQYSEFLCARTQEVLVNSVFRNPSGNIYPGFHGYLLIVASTPLRLPDYKFGSMILYMKTYISLRPFRELELDS